MKNNVLNIRITLTHEELLFIISNYFEYREEYHYKSDDVQYMIRGDSLG